MEHLKDTLYKKFKKTSVKIKDNLEGLENYLTAANIRKKVKHPLFLALKFPSCFKIYLEKRTKEQENKLQGVSKCFDDLLRLQKTLDEHFSPLSRKNDHISTVAIVLESKAKDEDNLSI